MQSTEPLQTPTEPTSGPSGTSEPAVPVSVEVKNYTLNDSGGLSLRGTISIPEKANSPLVILLHGRHLENETDQKPYYEGLNYLVKALAQNGFAAISIDLTSVYRAEDDAEIATAIGVVDAHLQALEKAVQGEKLFPVDLTGKVDVTKLSFVGHSRGGGMAPLLANYYASKGRTVTGNVLLAPTTYIGVLSEDGTSSIGTSDYKVPGLNTSIKASIGQPTAVLLAQNDGDVSDQPGFSYFLNAMQQSKPDVPILTTWLHQANHAGINTLLEGKTDPTEFPGATIASADKIQSFVQRYVVTVLKLSLEGKAQLSSLFRPDAFKDYPLPSAVTVYDPLAVSLLPKLDRSLKGFQTSGIEAKYIQSSANPVTAKDNGVLLIPGYDGSVDSYVPLAHLHWEQPGARIRIDLSGSEARKSGKGMLELYWLIDSTSPLSQKEPVRFELQLLDESGNRLSRSFDSSKDPSVWFEKGETTTDPTGREVYSHATPILTQLIDSAEDKAFHFEKLTALEIVSQSAQGAMALYDVRWRPLE